MYHTYLESGVFNIRLRLTRNSLWLLPFCDAAIRALSPLRERFPEHCHDLEGERITALARRRIRRSHGSSSLELRPLQLFERAGLQEMSGMGCVTSRKEAGATFRFGNGNEMNVGTGNPHMSGEAYYLELLWLTSC